MSRQIEGCFASFAAAGALDAFTRVKLTTGGKITNAGSEERSIGITQHAATAADEMVSVKLINAGGTFMVKAAGAISQSAAVYASASGKVDNAGTLVMGWAMEEATADGDIIECFLTD